MALIHYLPCVRHCKLHNCCKCYACPLSLTPNCTFNFNYYILNSATYQLYQQTYDFLSITPVFLENRFLNLCPSDLKLMTYFIKIFLKYLNVKFSSFVVVSYRRFCLQFFCWLFVRYSENSYFFYRLAASSSSFIVMPSLNLFDTNF